MRFVIYLALLLTLAVTKDLKVAVLSDLHVEPDYMYPDHPLGYYEADPTIRLVDIMLDELHA